MGITQKQIATELGVSTMTVSRVLSGKVGNKVSAELVRKIRLAAAEGHYQKNRLAGAMRSGSAPLMALCLHRGGKNSRAFLYWYELISSFTLVMASHNIEVLLVPYSAINELAGRLHALRAAGLICSVASNIMRGTEKELTETLQDLALPCVLFGKIENAGLPCISTDETLVSSILLNKLARQGAQRLRYFTADMPMPTQLEKDDAALFFEVPGCQEKEILTQYAQIPVRRVIMTVSDAQLLGPGGGFVINNHIAERSLNAYEILKAQLEHRPISENLCTIPITEDDITEIKPFNV